MNIKIKAAVQVASFILVCTTVAAGTRIALDALTAAYGETAVINGIIFATLTTAAYVCVGLLYDIRVAQLESQAKLKTMVDKLVQKQ